VVDLAGRWLRIPVILVLIWPRLTPPTVILWPALLRLVLRPAGRLAAVLRAPAPAGRALATTTAVTTRRPWADRLVAVIGAPCISTALVTIGRRVVASGQPTDRVLGIVPLAVAGRAVA